MQAGPVHSSNTAELQVFLPGGPDLPALGVDVPLGSWRTVELRLPVAAAPGRIRIRPVHRPCVVEVSEISLAADAGNILWKADTAPDLRKLETEGSFMMLPERGRCVFFSFGVDPLWTLPPFGELDGPRVLKITLCVEENFAAVSNAVTAAHEGIYLMAAQVRSAFAERNNTLREARRVFEKRAKKAEAERDSVLLEAQELQEQVQEQAKRMTELQAENEALLVQAEEGKKLRADYRELHRQFLEVQQSRSWRVTRPLRSASTLAQKLKQSFD